MSDWYDIDGNPVKLQQLNNKLGNPEYRHIGRHEIPTRQGNILVSTVWIGLDHNYGDGPPLIFETMIFGGDRDQECHRYSTRQEAVEGHSLVVQSVLHEDLNPNGYAVHNHDYDPSCPEKMTNVGRIGRCMNA